MTEDSDEHSSIKEAGGIAVGFRGTMENFNSDALARLVDVLNRTGKYVEGESGFLLGHIKAAVLNDKDEGLTVNLTNMEEGAQVHGSLEPQDNVRFDFMAAVLDTDADDLRHFMMHALEDSGISYKFDKPEPHEHHHCHNE